MVTAAGIYDLQGNPWAYSAGFPAQVSEVAAISNALVSGPDALASTGFKIAGEKYMFVKGDKDTFVVGKKGASGAVAYKCNTCILVAVHDDKIQSGACNNVVAKLGEWMKEQGI